MTFGYNQTTFFAFHFIIRGKYNLYTFIYNLRKEEKI